MNLTRCAALYGTVVIAMTLQLTPASARIVVELQPNTLTMPSGMSTAGLQQLPYAHPALLDTLDAYRCTGVVEVIADDGLPTDSTVVSAMGDTLHLYVPRRLYYVEQDSSASVDSLLTALQSTPGVAFAERESAVMPCDGPDDPYFVDGSQWNLANSNRGINAVNAWAVTTGSAAVSIGILDTGVDLDLVEFGGRASGNGYYGQTHGTRVASVAAAAGNNGTGIAGIDWHAGIMSRDYGNNYGSFVNTAAEFYADVMTLVNYGAWVINHSYTTDGSLMLYGAIENAYKLNRLNVAGMGNYSDSPEDASVPAKLAPGVLAVGALDAGGRYNVDSHHATHIALAAPGDEVPAIGPGGAYMPMGGTSIAAPHVTGAAALLWSMRPSLYNDDVAAVLKLSARDVEESPAEAGFDEYTGWGLVNVGAAVDTLMTTSLRHWTASGQEVAGSAPLAAYAFFGIPGLSDGRYNAYRHEVAASVTFPVGFKGIPEVWGRGVGSTGYGPWISNFGSGFCEVVPGSVTSTGCQLRTYVFEVYDPLTGAPKGWVPTNSPGSVALAYSVLGQTTPMPLTLNSSGATAGSGTQVSWTASCPPGDAPYSYAWRTRHYVSEPWSDVVAQGDTYTRTMLNQDIQVQCTAMGEDGDSSSQVSCIGSELEPLTPVVSIGGPRHVTSGGVSTWTAAGLGGRCCRVYDYWWEYRLQGGDWVNGGATAGLSVALAEGTYELKVTLTTSFEQTAVDTYLVVVGDGSPPAAVGDLDCPLGRTTTAVSWTAPGDDGVTGTAAAYDLRYSLYPITGEASFQAATVVEAVPEPSEAGSVECVELYGLTRCHAYYFALKTRDEAYNWSAMSNVASGTTLCSGYQEVLCGGDGLLVQGGSGGDWLLEGSVLGQDAEESAARVAGAASSDAGVAAVGVDELNEVSAASDLMVSTEVATDTCALEVPAAADSGRFAVRLSARGQSAWELSEVRVLGVAHGVEERAVLAGESALVGTLHALEAVQDSSGNDLAAALASGQEAVTVQAGSTWDVSVSGVDAGDAALFLEVVGRGADDEDDARGITVLAEDGAEGRRALTTVVPRDGENRLVVGSLPGGHLRLLFHDEYTVERLAWLGSCRRVSPEELDLVRAEHSEAGSVLPADDGEADLNVTLGPGEDLVLTYDVPAVQPDQARDFFLVVRGRQEESGGAAVALNAAASARAAVLPVSFALHQNRPNPFSGTTTVRFDLPVASRVEVSIFDLQGRRVRTLASGEFAAGFQSVVWDRRDDAGNSLRPSVYLCRLVAGTFRAQRTMVLLP